MGKCNSKSTQGERPKDYADLVDNCQPVEFDIVISNIQGRNFKKKNTFVKLKFGKNEECQTHYIYECSNPLVR
jgi:hypothetical protein